MTIPCFFSKLLLRREEEPVLVGSVSSSSSVLVHEWRRLLDLKSRFLDRNLVDFTRNDRGILQAVNVLIVSEVGSVLSGETNSKERNLLLQSLSD
jgi:hypothetical protein